MFRVSDGLSVRADTDAVKVSVEVLVMERVPVRPETVSVGRSPVRDRVFDSSSDTDVVSLGVGRFSLSVDVASRVMVTLTVKDAERDPSAAVRDRLGVAVPYETEWLAFVWVMVKRSVMDAVSVGKPEAEKDSVLLGVSDEDAVSEAVGAFDGDARDADSDWLGPSVTVSVGEGVGGGVHVGVLLTVSSSLTDADILGHVPVPVCVASRLMVTVASLETVTVPSGEMVGVQGRSSDSVAVQLAVAVGVARDLDGRDSVMACDSVSDGEAVPRTIEADTVAECVVDRDWDD